MQDGNVLLSRRFQTGYQDGNYGLVSGHVDEGEFATEALVREAKEEAGITVDPAAARVAHVMYRNCGDHERIDFFFVIEAWSGEITNCEPDKCDELSWFALDALPDNTIPYIREALNNISAGKFYSEFMEGGR